MTQQSRNHLSYRHVEELMLERGVKVDHATVICWVIKYTPLINCDRAVYTIHA